MNIENLPKFDFLKIEPDKEIINARILACSSVEDKQTPIFRLTNVLLCDPYIVICDDDKYAFVYENKNKEQLKKKLEEINQFLEKHKCSLSLFKP